MAFGPREEFDAKCSTCGIAIKVPFRPTEGRPVYCKEHFTPRQQTGGGGGMGGGRGGPRGPGGGGMGGPREMFDATCATCGKAIQVPFRPNPSRPVYCQEHYTPSRSR